VSWGGCSRRLTAASIAARSGRRPARPTARVLPPLSGGLHCGQAMPILRFEQFAGAPAVRRRAPLRPFPGRSDHGNVLVLPPLSGGLHCGTPFGTCWFATCSVLPPLSGGPHCGYWLPNAPTDPPGHTPAVQRWALLRLRGRRKHANVSVTPSGVLSPPSGGLHCGWNDNVWADLGHGACSRRLAAGSITESRAPRSSSSGSAVLPSLCAGYIARDPPAAPDESAPVCSRRLAAGSIAARTRSPSPSSSSSCSRCSQWAPLRLLGPPLEGVHIRVLPPSGGGLHCSFRFVPS
jgi:hypothetical protein